MAFEITDNIDFIPFDTNHCFFIPGQSDEKFMRFIILEQETSKIIGSMSYTYPMISFNIPRSYESIKLYEELITSLTDFFYNYCNKYISFCFFNNHEYMAIALENLGYIKDKFNSNNTAQIWNNKKLFDQ